METKTKKIIIGAIVAVTVIVIGIATAKIINNKNTPPVQPQQQTTASGPTENPEVTQQLKQLDTLRNTDATTATPPTPEQVQSQLKALDAQRGNQAPPTQEEVKSQLDQLNQLRKNSK